MSQEDLDDIRAAWEAINAGDFERFIEFLDPEVEFTSLVAEADAATYRGHAGARRWWDTVKETFGQFWAEDISLREVGDRALAQILLCGTVRDVKVEQTIWQVLNVEDGLVVSWEIFRTESEALAAIERSRHGARSR